MAGPAVAAPGDASVDAFIDTLWLEEGLSRNTLEAYRRDLNQLLAFRKGASLLACAEPDLLAYFSAQHASSKATTANRRLTVFKRYFRWALREGRIQVDPTLKLQAAKQALRVPKSLTEAQVEALLGAPDVSTAIGKLNRAAAWRTRPPFCRRCIPP